jgi:hypothetical protein
MTFIARLTRNVFIWAAIGLLVGLLLDAVGVLDNPFWAASGGIMLAAIFTGTDAARRDDAAGGGSSAEG